MRYCPITYEKVSNGEDYSHQGLKKLSPSLKALHPLPYTAAEQREEAMTRVGKMSLQGLQPKLSAKLLVKEEQFELVDSHGQYILKPQSNVYPELPQNEAVTMSLANLVGLEVPLHGLIYAIDGSMTYFVKRFDRYGKNKKLAVEDFAQLSGHSRDTKYQSSMEQVAKLIEKYCTFPQLEYIALFKLTLFSYLIGNEDMHLKNFSLITRGEKIMLSPAYDLLNSTIAQRNAHEELALPLNDKKSGFRRKDFLNYFANTKLSLNQTVTSQILQQFKAVLPQWQQLLDRSFLSENMRKKYKELLMQRSEHLEL